LKLSVKYCGIGLREEAQKNILNNYALGLLKVNFNCSCSLGIIKKKDEYGGVFDLLFL